MQNRIFYHIYPLGLLGVPKRNKFQKKPTQKLRDLLPWLDHLSSLGCNALYLGPVFESTSHGYDTADYFKVDRRLGTTENLRELVSKAHQLDIKVILDAVLNHVGRDFWAFKNLQRYGKCSKYKDWFSNVDFTKKGKYGDGFTYNAWHNHYQLVELNLQNIDVQQHLFSAVAYWMEQYQIDGLRLDAADVIDLDFLTVLASFCKKKKPDFWLMGEVVFGDYKDWANPNMLDSVTNYEYNTPLYESFNDKDFGKIARVLQRQFGAHGVYKKLSMYTFVDNHDVERAASVLLEPAHLYPLYFLLFTLPGIPAIYYGSEWGFEGEIRNGKHHKLRPKVNLKNVSALAKHPILIDSIKRFTSLRSAASSLIEGSYHELFVSTEQLVFARATKNDFVICIVNASREMISLDIPLQQYEAKSYTDLLNAEFKVTSHNSILSLEVPSCWGRVLSPV